MGHYLPRSQRDKVGCDIPVSAAKAVAVIAAGSVIRRTIRAFTTSGHSIVMLDLAPSVRLVEAATTLAQGGRRAS